MSKKKKLQSLKNLWPLLPHMLKKAYKTLYIEYEKLREGRKQHLYDLNSLQTEKSS
jgi:hypothetical protein